MDGIYVKKGQEIGMFHFGGSTHCLVFRPGVDLDFYIDDHNPGLEATNINLSSMIAKVRPIPIKK